MVDETEREDNGEEELSPEQRRIQSEELLSRKADFLEQYKAACPNSFMTFTRGLVIESQSGPKVFESCMAPFQRDVFEDMAPSIEQLRIGVMPDQTRFWWERTKKASKDADLAVIVLWLTAFPRKPFYGQIGAADRSQAGIIKDRLTNLLHNNKWLNDYVTVVNSEVRSTVLKGNNRDPMCTFDIMSSDVSGAHGGTPDLLIINELSHITRWEFVENLLDNADGVSQGMVIIATNAGIKGTPAEMLRKHVQESQIWNFYCLARPAPWHQKRTLDDAKKRETPARYNRLWRGIWASGKGDAISEEAIASCFRLKGPMTGPRENWVFIMGVDLGISRDHAGVVVLAVNSFLRQIRLAYMQYWVPVIVQGKKEVQINEVQNKIDELHKLFNLFVVGYDPHQAVLMSQNLRHLGVPVREVTFTPANLSRMASCLIQVIEEKILYLYDDPDQRLRSDFGKFNIVEKSYGYRVEATTDSSGHADVGTALLIALPMAVDMLAGVVFGLSPDDVIAWSEAPDLSEDEIKEMPDELLDIYEMDEPEHKRTSFRNFLECKKNEKPETRATLYVSDEELDFDLG